MRNFFMLLVLVFAFTIADAQQTIINDPNARKVNVESFSAISISGGIDLILSQGDEDAVAISASETSFRDRIRAEVSNGELKIWFDGKGWSPKSGNKKMKAYVSFKNLNKLTAGGASDVIVNGTIKGNGLVMRLSGASDFEGRVEVDKLTLDQSGASDATISGRAASLNIGASGASSIKGYELEVDQCDIHASGASDIKITVNKEMIAKASGASSISYKGAGVIKEVRSSGASSINKRS